MTRKWLRIMPHKAAVLLIALSVVLLIPAYGAFASQAHGGTASAMNGKPWFAAGHALQQAGHALQHHDGAALADRCASLNRGASASAAGGRLAPERGAAPALAPVVPLYPVATSFLAQSAAAPYPPPPTAAFHLRSARIQR